MPWVKIDDHFDEHPKLAAVGPLSWGMWLAGIAYCNRNLTDGFIPRNKAHALCSFEYIDTEGRIWELGRACGMSGEDIDSEWVIGTLVDGDLWEQVPGGYRIHDYEDYQPTKAQVLAERAKKQAAGRAGGKASAKARGEAAAEASAVADSKPVPVPVPNPGSVPSSSKTPPLPPQGGNAWNEELQPSREEVQSVACSECGATIGACCIGSRGRERQRNHATRVAEYRRQVEETNQAWRDQVNNCQTCFGRTYTLGPDGATACPDCRPEEAAS